MALDDRDYMRRRADRPTGSRDAVYDPRVFRSSRGSGGDGRPAPAAGPGDAQAGLPGWAWVFVVAIVVVIASALYARSQRAVVGTPPPSVPPTRLVAPQPAPVPPVPAMPPPARVDLRPAPPTGPAAPQDPYTTVYLCRTWQGAQFWSRQHCQLHQATLLRLHRVSSRLTWDQQVAVAQEEARNAARLLPP